MSKVVYTVTTGEPYHCQKHPFKDEFLQPNDTTEVKPPDFDSSKQFAEFSNGNWTVKDQPAPADGRDKYQMDSPPTAMELLRMERNAKLSQSDYRILPDYTGSDKDAWIEYRKKLRALPSSVDPKKLPEPVFSLEEGVIWNFNGWPAEPA